MPKDHQSFLNAIKVWLIPVLEILIFTYVIFKAWQTKQEFKRLKKSSSDFSILIKQACRDSFPKVISALVATEISIIYYLFSPSKKREKSEYDFYYHKKSGIQTIVAAFLFIVFIETIVLHYFIAKYSHWGAWIATALSIYAFFQIFSILRSLGQRPITIDIDSELLLLRYGLATDSETPLSNIESVELNRKALPHDSDILPLSQFGMLESHNTIIHFKKPIKLEKLYGLTSECSSIAIHFDEKEHFYEKIQSLI